MTYRVGAYARVSTNREEQTTSIGNQKEMFESYINDKGWTFERLYVERSSGTKAKRQELQKLISDIENNRIDIILVKDLSRLARNGELSYKISNLTKEKGIHIISLDGNINTLEKDDNLLGLLAWMYQMESENMSKRIKASLRNSASKGKYKGSLPPYGYYVKDGKLLLRDDETPTIVKRIFKEYLSGIGVDTIAKNLTLENVPTPAQINGRKNAGILWRGNTIKTILTNPHYTGDLVQGRTTSVSVVSTKRNNIDKEQYIVVSNTHEAIISKGEFGMSTLK